MRIFIKDLQYFNLLGRFEKNVILPTRADLPTSGVQKLYSVSPKSCILLTKVVFLKINNGLLRGSMPLTVSTYRKNFVLLIIG